MDKELKALEEIKTLRGFNEVELNNDKNINKSLDVIEQALLKAQELEKELADVEKVKSGKTIIHIGKDLVMMNKAKYYEYLELEEEPVSKRILQAKCEEQEKVLEVIKEKGVDVGYLKTCKTLEEYNSNCWNDEEDFNKKLTEEEFELLKRGLKNE